MTYRSAEEVREDLVNRLGNDFGNSLYWLDNSITNLHIQYNIFCELFTKERERVDTLNKASGLVSFYISKTLFESIVMGLCRISDPAQTFVRGTPLPNLTLKRLADFLNDDEELEFSEHCDRVTSKCKFARDRRNKILAHADSAVALGFEIVESASIAKVESALAAIRDAINYVNYIKLDSTTLYTELTAPLDDHRTFLRSLFLGNKSWEEYLEAQRAAIEASDYKKLETLDEEFKIPDWIN